jgi:hypothetical protein
VREHLRWWATTQIFFRADYEGEKMFSQNAQNSQLAQIFFKARGYFQSARNVWAYMKTFFNLYKVIIYNKNSSNAQNVLASGVFQSIHFFFFFWGTNEKNSTFITVPIKGGKSKIARNFFKHLGKKL